MSSHVRGNRMFDFRSQKIIAMRISDNIIIEHFLIMSIVIIDHADLFQIKVAALIRCFNS